MESANCHHHHTEEGNKVRKSPSLMRRTRSREAPSQSRKYYDKEERRGSFSAELLPFLYAANEAFGSPEAELTSIKSDEPLHLYLRMRVRTMEVRWHWIGHMSTNHVWVVRRSKKCDRNVSKYPLNWSSNADVEFKLITVITSTFSFPSHDHVILPSVDWQLVKYCRTIPFDVGG